jgi:flagellar basal body-associated protein FliL
MISVKEKWSEEYTPRFDDVELQAPVGWDSDQPHDVPVYHKRRSAGLWTALASLAVILAVVAVYGYSVASNQNAQLSWLPGLMKSVSSVRDRTNTLETRLKDWSSKQESLAAKVQKLDTGWDARLNAVSHHAALLVSNASVKEQADLSQRTAILKDQIAEMTSRQQADQVRLAQLEKELVSARQELASVRDSHAKELADLQEGQASTQDEISSLNDLLSTDQVDFEAQKGIDEEVVPGITFHLTGANVAHQHFQGWIWVAKGGHRVWFRRQAVDSPVVFYPVDGGEAYELVVTRVKQKEVAGYVLVPGASKGQPATAVSSNKPIARPGQGGL